jgi:hypothetical protein
MFKYDPRDKSEIYVSVTIRHGKYTALAETTYYRELPMWLYLKYSWFFRYREALIRVKNPKGYTKLIIKRYQKNMPDRIYKQQLKNKITGKKRKITELKNKPDAARKSWDELWPIEDHPLYEKVIQKIKRKENELKELQNIYENIEQ